MLSDEATESTKGKIFGFHRALDTLGAVLGPSFALLYLYYFPEQYKTLFYIAFIPGLLAIITTFLLKDKKNITSKTIPKTTFFSFLQYWNESPLMYRKVVIGLLLFTLFNSSDVFLLLKAKQAGLNDTMVIGFYIFYNLVYALFAFPVGIIADKIGLKTTFIIGLICFALTYIGFSYDTNLSVFFGLFSFMVFMLPPQKAFPKPGLAILQIKKIPPPLLVHFQDFRASPP